jgi:6,7-dimethyl-8-ribityllumazine synthase
MNKVLIVHTSWYKEYIDEMIKESSDILIKANFSINLTCAPGAIELAALAKNKILKDRYKGVLFLGVVIRGETTHYELVTNETFRSIGNLSMDFNDISFINNVLCVENVSQLKERIQKNTENNAKALIDLIYEKSS